VTRSTGRVRVRRGPPCDRPTVDGLAVIADPVSGDRAPIRRSARSASMPAFRPPPRFRRSLAITVLTVALLLGSRLTGASAGDLQNQITAARSAAAELQAQIVSDTAQIETTTTGLQAARRRLATIQGQLDQRVDELRRVQISLIAARDRLVDLENRMHRASTALADNLRANYEEGQPDLVSVVLDARGFGDLLDQVNFIQRIARQDASVITFTRRARIEVSAEAKALASLEQRDRRLAEQILGRRNQIAALRSALLRRQIAQLRTRAGRTTELGGLDARLRRLKAQAAKQAAQAAEQAVRAAATGNANVGGIALDTGGMVQAPAGAPPAIAQVMAAGNAIATLPYIYGGGHASFRADGYDCSGSVSYALAAAGLVSSPMVSGDFENWGDPGPGRWITIYANAGHVWMTVAGWRFDTVALAEDGTRWARGGGEFSGFVVRHPPGL
jgi:peptidoglycan hydrolase CwlO-like protein